MADKPQPAIILIGENRRAKFDYELEDKFEAGIQLHGSEVKMLRMGKVDLTDGWVNFTAGEAWLRGVNIPEMQGSPYSHEAKRSRKLLLNKKEIEHLQRQVTRDGMTVAVTKIYFKNGFAKVEIASARGKKKGDKREDMKRKDADKEARQAMARGRKGYG